MFIAPVSFNVNYGIRQVSFNGLTAKMKHQMYIDGKKDILEIMERRHPSQNSYVGQLPPGMFYKLPEKNRQAAVKEILSAFDTAAEEIREYTAPAGTNLKRSEETTAKMKQVFDKYGLIQDGEEFDIEYLGEGCKGKAFVLKGLYDDITGDQYVFKVFNNADRGPEWHQYKSHGNYAEPNTGAYWMENWGRDTQRGKFYFANIDAGYLVENRMDYTIPPPKRFVDEYTRGAKLTDEELAMPDGHNKCNNYSYDLGGVRVVNRVKNKSKTACHILNKIKQTPPEYRNTEWWKIYHSKKFDTEQKKAGLALAIKHMKYPEPYIQACLDENLPLVDMALAYALKYLPHKRAKELFEQLMQKNDVLTQVVLMNEIPLLARNQRIAERHDDLDVPKDEVNPKKVEIFYKIAEKHALAVSREHLASYVHLLPDDKIMKEFRKLVKMQDDRVYERLMHKIQIVNEEEFPDNLKFDMLRELRKAVQHNPYLKEKHARTMTMVCRSRQADD